MRFVFDTRDQHLYKVWDTGIPIDMGLGTMTELAARRYISDHYPGFIFTLQSK